MTIRLAPYREPTKLPEYVLWRMVKDGRAVVGASWLCCGPRSRDEE